MKFEVAIIQVNWMPIEHALMLNEVMTAMIALPQARRRSTKQDRQVKQRLNRELYTGLLMTGHDKSDSEIQYDEYYAEPGQTITESLHMDNTWIDFMRRHIQVYE